jgi:glucose-6-phosphate isomerase
MLKLHTQHAFVSENELSIALSQAKAAHDLLQAKTGPGNDFLGWLTPNPDYDEITRIKEIAQEIHATPNAAFIVIGIGGSYLGAKAAIDMLTHTFHNQLPNKVPIYFAGYNISGDYLHELLQIIKTKTVYLNVISKSGTTTEPAIAFRILKEHISIKYQDTTNKYIIATTDNQRGALRTQATQQKYRTFVIPDDVGGRFSVLTPVGLLPMAVAGINIEEVIRGAHQAVNDLNPPQNHQQNPALQYAALRNCLYRKGKTIEMLIAYEPKLQYLAEWWKQLFGESEGKDQKGIFPASAIYSTDLHSLGQYVQDGMKNLFETVISIQNPDHNLTIPHDPHDNDGLNYLFGKSLHNVNQMAFLGTLQAHLEGNVPNIVIEIKDKSPYTFGYLVYFFMLACVISGYMLGVNPFDQPGVEAYKKNMFTLLGKPLSN